METFRFKDKVENTEIILPKYIKDADGNDFDLQKLIGHIISFGRKKILREKEKELSTISEFKDSKKLIEDFQEYSKSFVNNLSRIHSSSDVK